VRHGRRDSEQIEKSERSDIQPTRQGDGFIRFSGKFRIGKSQKATDYGKEGKTRDSIGPVIRNGKDL
jgi:hypothetical protein